MRIFPTETSVEIRAECADAFAIAAANLPPHEPKITRGDTAHSDGARTENPPPRPMRPKHKRRS
ncbi:MAG: hypothetical protein NT133_15260 [Alphaproteobacteria bacterium]|nr:hypothetical protein [Alphaproteobacteria bacterium]